MIDSTTDLFVFRCDGASFRPSGISVRYTAMTAIGLEHAEANGWSIPVDREKLYRALERAMNGVDNSGDIGLLLWASARSHRALAERALQLLLEFPENARKRRAEAVHSTELALLVAGLSEALAADVGREREVRTRLERSFRQLLQQRGASGLLPFSRPIMRARGRLLRPMWQEKLGFFDAQVYTILAALRVDQVLGDAEARATAKNLGKQLLAHQHPLGQWAWHYNVDTGTLVDLYPVYSVHQDGMAPMALLRLERAGLLDTKAAVARGVAWLFGDNELGVPMVDAERALIWRSIRRKKPLSKLVYPFKISSLIGAPDVFGAGMSAKPLLEVDDEFRPYHYGWCLYGLAEVGSLSSHETTPISEAYPTLKPAAVALSSAPSNEARASNPV